MSEEKLSDIELSCTGIDLLVNNDWEGCEKLFTKHKDLSPLMNFCHSFMSYMRAILSFEDQLLEKAQKDLDNTEKLCSNPSGMISSLKKAFKISSSNNIAQQAENGASKQQTLEEKFTKAIILADCKLYSAILTFIRQDVSAYLSSGILQMRKSWKMYAKIQKQLYDIYKKLEPNAEQIYGSDPNSSVIELWLEDADESEASKSSDNNNNQKTKEDAVSQAISDLEITDEETSEGLSLETTKRLLGAVSFGYGLFQICLSFMPPNILKLIKMFGFEGDRSVAIKAINFTSLSRDMRAPFADMILLWYSTIATPMFGISEGELQISNEDTKLVLEKNLKRYPKSSLFFYMKGKYHRSIMKDLDASLASYHEALAHSKHIREIQLISMYEIGWIHLGQLDYEKALENFQILQKESKWSKSFSAYICAVLNGCLGKFAQANAYVKEAIKIFNSQPKKNNPIELYSVKRNEYLKKNPVKSKEFCELLAIELLYLWVSFPFCDEKSLQKMLKTKCLFEGVIHMNLKNKEFGEQCLNESLARYENEKNVTIGKYVQPSAYYELACFYVDEKDFSLAKSQLSKAQSFKDYELDNRISVQIRSLQRKIKFLTETKPGVEEAAKRDETQQKNFFIS